MANHDITSLINIFENMSGFQRTNRYDVAVYGPGNLDTKHITQAAKLVNYSLRSPSGNAVKFIASSVQLPSHGVEYYQDNMAPSAGYVNVPVKRNFDQSFKIDFIVDTNWGIREYFEDWIDWIFFRQEKKQQSSTVLNPETRNSLSVRYFDDLTGSVEIGCLDYDGNAKKVIAIKGAWPRTIMSSNFSHDLQNNYLTLTVDMCYRYYDVFTPGVA